MSKEPGIDLASLDTVVACDKGIDLELKHPVTNEGLGVFISIVGKDSQIFRNDVKASVNKQLREQALNGAAAGKPKGIVKTVDQIEQETIDLLVKCTTGWREVKYQGKELPFSKTNAKTLYTEQLWVRRQVDDAVGTLELFLPTL